MSYKINKLYKILDKILITFIKNVVMSKYPNRNFDSIFLTFKFSSKQLFSWRRK